MRALEITDFDHNWSGKYPIDEQDLINGSIPINLLLKLLNSGFNDRTIEAIDGEMLESIREKGFQTTNTPLWELIFNRGGGYINDQGIAKHIASGAVGVKSGAEIQSLERGTIVLTDGSRLEADAIILG